MDPIIQVQHLCKTFQVKGNVVDAAKNISFDIERGDIFWNHRFVRRGQKYTGTLPEPAGTADFR